MHVGYARVSTLEQDLSAQREALERLGVESKNIYFDHGLTGTTRARPGLREALAATREGDTLVVTKLDRLARSLPDARDIADELTIKGVALSLGGSVYGVNVTIVAKGTPGGTTVSGVLVVKGVSFSGQDTLHVTGGNGIDLPGEPAPPHLIE